MLIILSDYLEWSLRKMIKSDFERCVLAAQKKYITDYQTFIRVRLFCDYLWEEIKKNEENKRDTNTTEPQ